MEKSQIVKENIEKLLDNRAEFYALFDEKFQNLVIPMFLILKMQKKPILKKFMKNFTNTTMRFENFCRIFMKRME